jgi:hypothetical protein
MPRATYPQATAQVKLTSEIFREIQNVIQRLQSRLPAGCERHSTLFLITC